MVIFCVNPVKTFSLNLHFPTDSSRTMDNMNNNIKIRTKKTAAGTLLVIVPMESGLCKLVKVMLVVVGVFISEKSLRKIKFRLQFKILCDMVRLIKYLN